MDAFTDRFFFVVVVSFVCFISFSLICVSSNLVCIFTEKTLNKSACVHMLCAHKVMRSSGVWHSIFSLLFKLIDYIILCVFFSLLLFGMCSLLFFLSLVFVFYLSSVSEWVCVCLYLSFFSSFIFLVTDRTLMWFCLFTVFNQIRIEEFCVCLVLWLPF